MLVADLIKDFFITDANYLEAWSTLFIGYENRKAIIRVHVRYFFNLQKLKN